MTIMYTHKKCFIKYIRVCMTRIKFTRYLKILKYNLVISNNTLQALRNKYKVTQYNISYHLLRRLEGQRSLNQWLLHAVRTPSPHFVRCISVYKCTNQADNTCTNDKANCEIRPMYNFSRQRHCFHRP